MPLIRNQKTLVEFKDTESEDIALELCSVISSLSKKGYTPARSGNFSVLLNLTPLRFLITPSGVDKSKIKKTL
jgi:ribulose-5-phosphate 4-epimerase/fuculose-1-phosphate aldolase